MSEKNSTLNTFSSASQMLAALRSGQISALELLELHLQQIERYNPQLNAIVYPDYDNARKTAQQADAKRAQGADQPLLGLPITIKDCIHVEGLPSTMGVPQFRDFRPASDGRLAGRAKAAGAVLLGKTNVPPYAGDLQSDNPIYGRTNNPWNLERTPGGSTGGGGAALAAGLTPLEFGSDIGGSIRIPASFCGVYGHRPSESALVRSGHLPGSPLPNPALVMGVQGPLARSPKDLRLAFDVVSGAEIGEEIAWRLQLPASRHTKLTDFRVAVLPRLDWLPVDDEIWAAQENLVEKLSRLGVQVQTLSPAELGDLREYHKVYRSMLQVVLTIGVPLAERQAIAELMRASGDEFLIADAAGYVATAEDFVIWHARREQYRAGYRAFFKDWDILLAPITVVPAFPHDNSEFTRRVIRVNGQTAPYLNHIIYASFATLAGQPTTAFPVGFNREGLPLGLQAIGPYLEDYTPMQFAELLEAEFGGYQPPPGYGA